MTGRQPARSLLRRRAARLFVLDDARRVLLFKYDDGGRVWWATPGGGLEGKIELGERVREAHAEEGIVAAKWWTASEVGATTELVFPDDLALRLESRQLWIGQTRATT